VDRVWLANLRLGRKGAISRSKSAAEITSLSALLDAELRGRIVALEK
jgi:hypothetical protein